MDCFATIDSPLPDFEDALVVVCADKENLDFIITRDIEFLKFTQAVSPKDFLENNHDWKLFKRNEVN